jgi:hypothetical protein
MKKLSVCLLSAALLGAATPPTLAQFSGYVNHGLVGVGRVSGASFDARGPGLDALGGFGSTFTFDTATWARAGDDVNGYSYTGQLFAAPDRGFGDGTFGFIPRIDTFSLTVTPYYGAGPVPQNQIWLNNTNTMLLTAGGTYYTGCDADDVSATNYPQSSPTSVGQGHRSLDPEGLVIAPGGGFFLSDEYGPFVYKFSADGALEYTLTPPVAYWPKWGNYPGATGFTSTNVPTSGRRNNRGLEGLSITPDGKRLLAMLQAPLMQDGGAGNLGRNTRLLVFDVDPASSSFKRTIGEYVYQLTLNGSTATNRNTPISAILAINSQTFLALERDNLGYGSDVVGAPLYKRIVLASLTGATNILNTGYDLEKGAPNQVSLPSGALPSSLAPVVRQELVDLLDPNQLAKFGVNLNYPPDTNTLNEKWESLTLVSLADPSATNDFLMLVGSDNDFRAPITYHNGLPVATNSFVVDTLVLAYRVTLTNYGAPTPSNQWPGVSFTGPTNATLSTPARVNLSVTAYDQDGIVTNVAFYEGETKLGEDTTFPFALTLNAVPAGSHTYRAICTDNEGATGTAAKVVEVTVDNLPPSASLSGPTNALAGPATVALSAVAGDADGYVAKVEFFDEGAKVGEKASVPYSLVLSNVAAGPHNFTAVATDNQGAMTPSASFMVRVKPDNDPPAEVTLLSPTNGLTLAQPATIAFTARASDPDGAIAKVEYFNGSTKLGQAASPPYAFTATNFPAGASLVRAVAYDNLGATADSLEVTIIVLDKTPPKISCPETLFVNCGSGEGTPVNFTVTATDNNDGAVAVTCAPASGSLFPYGTNTVACRAQDAAGNRSTNYFQVIILPSRVSIERAVILRWGCGEVLQGADELAGPWTDLPEAASPWAVPASESKRYYRVRGGN